MALCPQTEDKVNQEIVQVFFSASFVVLSISFGCGLIILGHWVTERVCQGPPSPPASPEF
jgi:hypothetical protein